VPRAGLTADAVVDAATALVDSEGAGALAMGALASRLEVRTPSLYKHVDGVDDLRVRIATAAARDLARACRDAATGCAGDDALDALAAAYRDFARARPGSYALLQPARDDPGWQAAAAEVVDVLLRVLAGFGLRGGDAVHAARAVRSALHGFVSLEAAGGFGLPEDLGESWRRLLAGQRAALRAGAYAA
jgi:AcrR family transcriptional regulator